MSILQRAYKHGTVQNGMYIYICSGEQVSDTGGCMYGVYGERSRVWSVEHTKVCSERCIVRSTRTVHGVECKVYYICTVEQRRYCVLWSVECTMYCGA